MTTASTCPARPADPLQLSPESFARFCQYITRELGIKMSDAKLSLLQSRLQRRLRVLGLQSLEDYQRHLFDSPEGEAERVHFIDAITTNKTDFFREPEHFAILREAVLPQLDPARCGAAPAPWSLRLWCAGCSSGEEAYTLAMVLAEHAATRPGFDFAITASDISTRVLEHARLAIYDEDRVAPVPAALRAKYLLRSKDPQRRQVRIAPELRLRVNFRRLNFMDQRYEMGVRFDAIFFRNVMIYFDKPTQEAVLQRLCRCLAPGGFLFVGHSESLAGLALPLESVSAAVFRKLA